MKFIDAGHIGDTVTPFGIWKSVNIGLQLLMNRTSPLQLPVGAGPQNRHPRAPRQGAQVGGGRRPQEEVRGQGQDTAQRAGKMTTSDPLIQF